MTRFHWDKANSRAIEKASNSLYVGPKKLMTINQRKKLEALCSELNRPFPDCITTSISASNWIRKLSKEI
jgi:hypothetical protein